jgi:hypothetical protein
VSWRLVAMTLVLACGKAGVVTGGEISHKWTFSKGDRELFWTLVEAQGCPEIEEHLGDECTQETLRKAVRYLGLWSRDGGDTIEAEVKFDPD